MKKRLEKFYYNIGRIYHFIANLFSYKQLNIISIFGTILLILTFLMKNMFFFTFFKESFDFFRLINGFIIEFLFSISFILMILPIFKDEIKEYNFDKKRFNLYFVMPLSIYLIFYGLSFLTAGIGRLKYILVVLFIFIPVINQLRNNEKYFTIVNRFLNLSIIFGFIYFVLSFMWAPYAGIRYPALSVNANRLGELCLFLIASILIVSENSKKTYMFLYSIMLGITLTFSYLTRSRTIFLIIILLYISLLIFRIFNIQKNWIKTSLIRLSIVSGSFLLTFLIFDYTKKPTSIYENGRFPDTIYYRTVLKLNGQKYIQIDKDYFDEVDDNLFDRLALEGSFIEGQIFEKNKNPILSNIYSKADKISNGRMGIWVNYLSRSRALGQKEERIDKYGNEINVTRAHNIFVQVIYDAGFISGLGYLLYILRRLKFSIKSIFVKKSNYKYLLFNMIIVIVFFIHGLFEASYFTLYHPIAFTFFLSGIPLINNSNKLIN